MGSDRSVSRVFGFCCSIADWGRHGGAGLANGLVMRRPGCCGRCRRCCCCRRCCWCCCCRCCCCCCCCCSCCCCCCRCLLFVVASVQVMRRPSFRASASSAKK